MLQLHSTDHRAAAEASVPSVPAASDAGLDDRRFPNPLLPAYNLCRLTRHANQCGQLVVGLRNRDVLAAAALAIPIRVPLRRYRCRHGCNPKRTPFNITLPGGH